MIEPSRSAWRLGAVLWIALSVAGCAAQRTHREGLRLLDADRLEEGIARLEQASRSNPENQSYRLDFLRARELAADRLVALADRERALGKLDAAQALYARVLSVNPADARGRDGLKEVETQRRHLDFMTEAANSYNKGDMESALDRLRAVLMENPTQRDALALQRRIDEQRHKDSLATPGLQARLIKPVTLQFRDAGLKIVFDALSRSTGINFIFDRDIRPDLKITIYARQLPVEDAIDLILLPNQLGRKVLAGNTVLIYPNTPQKQHEYEDLVIKTFYLANVDVKFTQTMIKTMLKTKDVFVDEKLNLLMMRDTPDAIRLAERLIAAHDLAEPEVTLELEVLEVSRTRLTELGVKLPNQIGLSTLDLTGGAFTLDDLKGATRSDRVALSPAPNLTLNLKKETGNSNLLSNPRIRVKNREKARVLVGDRLPVISAVITPSTGTPITTETVQYLDVGLKLELEPDVYLDGDVGIKVSLEVSTASNRRTTANGTTVYDIGTRTASTALRLRDGETQILMGLIRDDDRRSASRVPGLGDMPLAGRLFSSHLDDRQKTEIVLSITPRVVRNVHRANAQIAEFWSGTEATYRTRPLALRAGPLDATAEARATAGASVPAGNAAAGATAEKPPEVELRWSGPTQAVVGAPVTLALHARTSEALTSASLQIAYDPLAFGVIDVIEGTLPASGNARTFFNRKVDAARGRILVSFNRAGTLGATGEGTLLEVILQPLAPSPRVPVEVTVITPVGADGQPLAASVGAKHEISVANSTP